MKVLAWTILMATVGLAQQLAATSHGSDAGGQDPDRPRRLPSQCEELGTIC